LLSSKASSQPLTTLKTVWLTYQVFNSFVCHQSELVDHELARIQFFRLIVHGLVLVFFVFLFTQCLNGTASFLSRWGGPSFGVSCEIFLLQRVPSLFRKREKMKRKNYSLPPPLTMRQLLAPARCLLWHASLCPHAASCIPSKTVIRNSGISRSRSARPAATSIWQGNSGHSPFAPILTTTTTTIRPFGVSADPDSLGEQPTASPECAPPHLSKLCAS